MNPRLVSRLIFSMGVFSMLLFSCADPRTGECSADTDCPDGERCVLQACILDDTQPIDDTDASDASDTVQMRAATPATAVIRAMRPTPVMRVTLQP